MSLWLIEKVKLTLMVVLSDFCKGVLMSLVETLRSMAFNCELASELLVELSVSASDNDLSILAISMSDQLIENVRELDGLIDELIEVVR
ncbi:hypothetical protein [Pseudomonas sp. TCU-HL1]|uniref:hypothetical protein n=1 Tax=Pseudomonas sp. TCU-HL1 TaxID=1856685 RepID=UPI0011AB66F5|nr:hypothetical protein [Pseudomonas sp. TCU-HL1]